MLPTLTFALGALSGIVCPQFTTRVSLDDDGIAGAGASVNPALSGTGRFVAFQSNAPLDANSSGYTDIYVRDRQNSSIALLSFAFSGGPANSFSTDPSISYDGRFVAFHSNASNLVSGDLNAVGDVFLADRDPDGNGVFDEGNGNLIRLSESASGGEGNAPSSLPILSGNGHCVTFISLANNLVAGDLNGVPDQFIYDLPSGNLTLGSLASDGSQGNLPSGPGALSHDGRFLSFTTQAANFDLSDSNGLSDIYLRDRDPDGNGTFDEGNETTVWVSASDRGYPANSACTNSDISADGSLIVFQSAATNLIVGGTAGYSNIYIRHIPSYRINMISVNGLAQDGNESSTNPEISSDGLAVVFQSQASNLVPGDTNAWDDAFLADLSALTMERVSLNVLGKQVSLYSQLPTIGATRAEIAFQSPDGTFVPYDSNGDFDIFVRGNGAWSPQLVAETIQRGTMAHAMTRNGIDGESVWLLFSMTGLGAGPCPPSLGGTLCLDLLGPVRIAGSAVADIYGAATFNFFVPPGAPLVDVFAQAVIQRGSGNVDSVKSNPISRTILP
jgi:Tol biopolymer transport system component